MKKLIFLIFGLFLFSAVTAGASGLAWQYPTDWDDIDGYILRYVKNGTTTPVYLKHIAKTDVSEDGTTVIYPDFEANLHLAYDTTYDIALYAYNEFGESISSTVVPVNGPAGYTLPAENLPPPVETSGPNVPTGLTEL